MNRSRGALMFARLGSTQLQHATRLGVSTGIVAMWMSGQRVPGIGNRKLLLAKYKIPIESWDEEPESAASPPPSVRPPAHWGENTVASRISMVERKVDHLFHRLEDPEGITLLEEAKVLESLTRNLANLRRLKGEEASEIKVMKHAKMIEVRDEILAIARDYPTAKGHKPILRLILEKLEAAEVEEQRRTA